MPKNLFQDMVKVKRERQGVVNVPAAEKQLEEKEEIRERATPERIRPSGSRHTSYTFWILAGVCLVFFLFSLSYLFSKATVTINPRTAELALDENFSASTDGGEDVLPFDGVVLSGEETKLIPATEEKDVAEKASGLVILYNAFSSAPQRLDINTRLEGSNDKIYKTEKAVVVPGVGADGKPGSVEVKVFAAEAGAEYNSTPLDFKILGFKGTPKYAKFYGRSKEEIAGGFVGKSPFVSETEKESVIAELKTTLQAKLFQKATDQIPSGFILFNDASSLEVEADTASTATVDGATPFKIKGTLYGILFDEKKLTEKIAKAKIEKYDGAPVYIPNIKDLAFSLTSKDSETFADMRNINFNLSGAAKIVHKVDIAKITKDLLGKSKGEFNQILLQYPNIDSADLSLSPFWKRSIPDKTKKIKIIVNYP